METGSPEFATPELGVREATPQEQLIIRIKAQLDKPGRHIVIKREDVVALLALVEKKG